MDHAAHIIAIDPDVENQVVIVVAGVEITCFVAVCPQPIAVGGVYPCSLHLWAADGLELRPAGPGEVVGMRRIGDGFGYKVVGELTGAMMRAGLAFEEDLFASEYAFLSGQLVVVTVDRIHVEFL